MTSSQRHGGQGRGMMGTAGLFHTRQTPLIVCVPTLQSQIPDSEKLSSSGSFIL